MIKILFLGDIVGKPGRRIVEERLSSLVLDYSADVVIGNVENIAGGVGVTPETLDRVFGAGVDIATSGNHIFDKKEMAPAMDGYPNLLREFFHTRKQREVDSSLGRPWLLEAGST